MKRRRFCGISAGVIAMVAAKSAPAVPAFPGAEGFGANAVGGRAGNTVYHVTSLADTNTAGTLRYGITHMPADGQGQTIVFDVGGTIVLTSNLEVKNVSKLTIAGQTAPGPGITIVNSMPAAGQTSGPSYYKFAVTSSAGSTTSDIIVRYLTVRRGVNNSDTAAGTDDSIGVLGDGTTQNVILDHVSASWATDEDLSVTNNVNNVTVQYAYISESLNPRNHAYGSLIRPQQSASVSFNHDLYANNRSRNPRPGDYNGSTLSFDFRNNVVYNWSDRASYTGGSSDQTGTANTEHVNANYIGNYFVAGPATPTGGKSTTGYTLDTSGNQPVYVQMFQQNNQIDSNHNATRDGTDTGWGMFAESTGTSTLAFPVSDASGARMTSEFAFPGLDYISTDSPDVAYAKILASGGGSLPGTKSTIDARIANDVQTNTGAVINAPDSTEWSNLINQTPIYRPANWDTDGDGMPNWWETARGLNPNSLSTDHENKIIASNGYSNLENYLNDLTLVANWNLDANGAWSDYLNWQGARPELTDSTANFVSGITAPRTITVDIPVSIGQMSFDGAKAYTLDGAGTITMQVISGTAAIDVTSGSHAIAAPLALANDTAVSVAGGSALTVSNLQDSSAALVKSGAGELIVNRVRAGSLDIGAGTVSIMPNGSASSVSYVDSLSVSPSAALDLNDNDLVVNHGDFSAIQALVFQGYRQGADASATGIVSSIGQTAVGNPILALVDNSLVGSPDYPFGSGHAIASNAVIGKYTYFGDTNLDGQVTADDYGALDANFGATGIDPGIAWIVGDTNFDGHVTADDYGTLDANFGLGVGNPLSAEGAASVPEPGITLLAGGLSIALRRRRRSVLLRDRASVA